jgi:hypothetical protein
VKEKRKRKSHHDFCEVILLEKSTRESEVESRVEASEAKVEAMSREVAELRRKMDSETKALELMVKIINMIVEQVEKGRRWIWVDVKLVEWVDKQVETGKYRSRSHAVEKIIRSKMREETTRAYEI